MAMGLRELDPTQVDPDTGKVVGRRPPPESSCGETTRLLEVDWKQQAEDAENRRRRAQQQVRDACGVPWVTLPHG